MEELIKQLEKISQLLQNITEQAKEAVEALEELGNPPKLGSRKED